MTAAPVELLPFIEAVEERLGGELPVTSPPTLGYLSKPDNVPTIDGAGHVQRYWVLHPFVGTPDLEDDLGDTAVASVWTFQLTIAAAFPRDVYALVEAVQAALYRWTPVVAGYVCGPLKPPPGYDPGNARPDDSVKPIRFYLPLQYRTTITRTNA